MHIVDGVLELVAVAPRQGYHAADLVRDDLDVGRGRGDRGLPDVHLDLVRDLVQTDQHVALFDALVVVGQHLRHLTRDAGGHERGVAVHVGVIRGDCVEDERDPGNAKAQGECQHHDAGSTQQHPFPETVTGARRDGAGRNMGVRTLRLGSRGGSSIRRRRLARRCRPVSRAGSTRVVGGHDASLVSGLVGERRWDANPVPHGIVDISLLTGPSTALSSDFFR